MGSCSRNRSLDLDRTAILPFDNLSGDPALEPQVPLTQAILQAMTGTRIAFANQNLAVLNGATALARGVIERTPKGRIRVVVDVISTDSHKLLRSVTGEGATALEAATMAASILAPGSKPLAFKSPKTVELWTAVLGGGSPPQVRENCRELLEADPAFSPAYLNCLEIVAAGFPREEVVAVGERAYGLRDQLTVAAQNAAGQMLFQAGRFEHAAELLRRGAAMYPVSWNQVGYAEAMLGHAAESRKALDDYRKLGGDEANAVDSMGETLFILGKYEEAEKYFLECDAKFPQTAQGRTAKIKAAAMKAMRGDRTGAEDLARKFIDPLRKSGQDVRQIEEAWRAVILEQDPKEMRRKVENTIIGIPGRNPNAPPAQ